LFDAFFQGIYDSCLPLALLRLTAFYIVLSWGADTKLKGLGGGLVFLLVAILMEALVSGGLFDAVFILEWFGVLIKIAVGVCCAGLLVCGVLQALDWWRLRGEPGLLFIRPPAFWAGKLPEGWRFHFDPPVPGSGVRYMVCAALTSFGASLISGLWQGDFVFQAFSFLLSGQDQTRAFVLYGVYLSGQLSPLFMAWIFTAVVRERWRPDLAKLSFLKVIAAAFCLALGFGLVLSFMVNPDYNY
jgi:hypothetical protein